MFQYRPGAQMTVLALSAAAAALVSGAGCDLGVGQCAANCVDGLTISFDATFAADVTYQIDIGVVTPAPEVFPVMTCLLGPVTAGGQQLLCSGGLAHSEQGTTIRILDSSLSKLLITFSVGGAKIGEAMFQPSYSTQTACGQTCTSARIVVTAPKAAAMP